jgi:hypothetical protein
MKKLACVAVAAVAVSLMGAAFYISQDQALVGGALGELKFESVAGKPGLIGAPSRFRITKQTIDFLEKLSKEGKQIEVHANGQVKIVATK